MPRAKRSPGIGVPSQYRTNKGRRPDIPGDYYFNSSWEANVARLFEHFKTTGDPFLGGDARLVDWSFETTKLAFPVTRGPKATEVDFDTALDDGSVIRWEVKGYMGPLSVCKILRVRKYHPDVKFNLLDEEAYREIERNWSHRIPGWEYNRSAMAARHLVQD